MIVDMASAARILPMIACPATPTSVIPIIPIAPPINTGVANVVAKPIDIATPNAFIFSSLTFLGTLGSNFQ